jgi:hypothetical protein
VRVQVVGDLRARVRVRAGRKLQAWERERHRRGLYRPARELGGPGRRERGPARGLGRGYGPGGELRGRGREPGGLDGRGRRGLTRGGLGREPGVSTGGSKAWEESRGWVGPRESSTGTREKEGSGSTDKLTDQYCSSCNQKKPLLEFGRFFTYNACR